MTHLREGKEIIWGLLDSPLLVPGLMPQAECWGRGWATCGTPSPEHSFPSLSHGDPLGKLAGLIHTTDTELCGLGGVTPIPPTGPPSLHPAM